MTPETKAAIIEHAQSEYPRESCGLVLIAKGRERYYRCTNKATTPSEHFIIGAEDYAFAEDQGEITAVVHSHPDVPARPSEGDRVACEASGVPWYIVSVMPADTAPEGHDGGAIVEIEPEGYLAPLVGRPFQHGVLDCYSVIRDWYARERDIALPDFVRPDNWWNDGHSNLYLDHFAEAGFAPVGQYPQLEVGDVILMQIRSKNDVPNHAAVYLGDGQMLHHLYGRLSSRDTYVGYWRECTRLVVRRAAICDKGGEVV